MFAGARASGVCEEPDPDELPEPEPELEPDPEPAVDATPEAARCNEDEQPIHSARKKNRMDATSMARGNLAWDQEIGSAMGSAQERGSITSMRASKGARDAIPDCVRSNSHKEQIGEEFETLAAWRARM